MTSPVVKFYEREKLDIAYGQGVYYYLHDGTKCLDFAAGYAANSFGSCHPRLVEVITEQAKKLWHISNFFEIPGMVEYAQLITDNTFADAVYFACTGAEVVETSLKIARWFFSHSSLSGKKRYKIICFNGAFHGRTLACASASDTAKIRGFEPPVDGFKHVPFNDLKAVEMAICDETAAVLIEPIQGEGGIVPSDQDFMKGLRALCDKHGILLIVDEVQSGAGRTGFLFAYEMYGIKPDILAAGKGIGSGYPISACLVTKKLADLLQPGTHGSTFGGNPMAMAIGKAVMEMLLSDGFLDHVKSVGGYLKSELQKLQQQYPDKISDVRGEGLMLGLKLNEKLDVKKVNKELLRVGLASIPAGQNVLRCTPPLIIEKHHVDEAIEKLTYVLKNPS
jgi:acetylornithine/N-succinyldiaminopimelate aminotransferase